MMLSQISCASPLTIAVPKGRMQDECMRALTAIGLAAPATKEDSRGLVLHSPGQAVQYLLARPTDIPTYVEQGTADLGLSGKDVLLEERRDVYELLDLGLGSCRIVLAGPKHLADHPLLRRHFPLKVATKYPRIAKSFFLEKQWPVELISLHGAIELAPNVGLADLIVDIVSTGQTLAQNNLVILEEIEPSSVRMIANRASYILKWLQVRQIMRSLRQVILGSDDHD